MTDILPQQMVATAMYHLVGAMPLESWNSEGPTLYALTIVGMRRGSPGGATLVGPAVNTDGLTDSWPAIARKAAAELFSRPPQRRAGAVAVIVIIQIGNTSHCAVVNVPTAATPRRPRGGRRHGPVSSRLQAGQGVALPAPWSQNYSPLRSDSSNRYPYSRPGILLPSCAAEAGPAA